MTNQIQPVAADVTPTFTEFLASPEEKALEEKVYENLPTEELQQLIKSAQAGNQQALDKLCKQFAPLVESIARNYTFYSLLKEDGINICWLKFIEIILKHKKSVHTTFPGYVKKVLYNEMLDVISKSTEVIQYLTNDDEDLDEMAIDHNFEEQLVNNQDLLQALKTLTPKEQKLIYNYYFEERTFRELSQITGLKLHTIKSQQFRIIKKLQEYFRNLKKK